MAADPVIVNASRTMAWTIVKYAVPMIIVVGIISGFLIYLRTKAEKKLDSFIQKRKDKKAATTKVCPQCGGTLMKRKGKFGEFLGCSNYPKCRYTAKPTS